MWQGVKLAVFAFVLVQQCSSTSLSVIQRLEDLWGNIAFTAAEASVKAVNKQTGMKLTLRDVPLDNFKVFVGRQHQLGVEVDRLHYEVALSSELDVNSEVNALPDYVGKGRALAEGDWWQLRKQGGIPLPDITLAGPVELLLQRPYPLTAYLPHPADVGEASRIVLAPGAIATIRGLKALSLRRPVQLPRLPAQYLAEVYAQIKLGQADEGTPKDTSGILFLSRELQAAAANLSGASGVKPGQAMGGMLLSLEAEPLGGSLTVMAAPERAGEAAQKLRAKRLKDGSLEISPRQALEASGSPQAALVALQQPGWAWPLPRVPLAQWVPYESLLRGIMASHPFDLERVMRKGVGLKLTKSSLRGVGLISFDMHVRGEVPEAMREVKRKLLEAMRGEREEGEEGEERERVEEQELGEFAETSQASNEMGPLEVWEVTVQLKELEGGAGWDYLPLNARRKEAYHNTITLSPSAHDALQGNVSVEVLGYDHHDQGLARNHDP